jgi:hypothetical protein
VKQTTLKRIGFGGNDFKNFRLWIDDDLETGSYVSADDTTYEKGYLADPSIRHFNVKEMLIFVNGKIGRPYRNLGTGRRSRFEKTTRVETKGV